MYVLVEGLAFNLLSWLHVVIGMVFHALSLS